MVVTCDCDCDCSFHFISTLNLPILVTVNDATGADGSYHILLHGTYATVTCARVPPALYHQI